MLRYRASFSEMGAAASRTFAKEAVRVAEDMAKPGPIRVTGNDSCPATLWCSRYVAQLEH
jgi:hypothetical protein